MGTPKMCPLTTATFENDTRKDEDCNETDISDLRVPNNTWEENLVNNGTDVAGDEGSEPNLVIELLKYFGLFVLMLVSLALLTLLLCVRPTKTEVPEVEESQRQVRKQSREPPDYEKVLRMEEELPSYEQAVHQSS